MAASIDDYLGRWRAIAAAMRFRKLYLATDPPKGDPEYAQAMRDLVNGFTSAEDVAVRDLQFGILELILKYDLYYEGSFFSQEEWSERESYAENSTFVMTCEGDVCHALYYDTCPEAKAEFEKLVEDSGFYVEWLYCWAVAFYKGDLMSGITAPGPPLHYFQVVFEENGHWEPTRDFEGDVQTFGTLREAEEARRQMDCPEGLSIMEVKNRIIEDSNG